MTTCFVDTNVLVYAKDKTSPSKMNRANAWLAALIDANAMVISAQVLREYYSVMLRKDRSSNAIALARGEIRSLSAFAPESLRVDYLEAAWALQDRFSLALWDALLVASAQIHGCNAFVSEDLQPGQNFDTVRVVNPFATAPEDILGA
jgi:predicted nucleic acid-binding protein